jgi:protein-tyrosine phosphatase
MALAGELCSLLGMRVSEPVIQSIRNFRDCGGYPTRDGRRVVTGRLFRSAHQGDATDADLQALRDLGIGTIVDLRRPGERERAPSRRWPDFSARVIEHIGPAEEELPPHLQAFKKAGFSPELADIAMMDIYRETAFDPMLVALFSDYFAALAESDSGVLVHCAAGKDRTGIAVALTHHMLGVSEEDIAKDFLETNNSNLADGHNMAVWRSQLGSGGKDALEDAVRVVLSVKLHYLETAFAEIVKRTGSVDAYLRDVLDVTDARRAAILLRMTAP